MFFLFRTLYKLAVLAAVLPILGWSQMTRLTFRPLASAYSTQLDRLIMTTSGPNRLHIYDALANVDQTVALPGVPLSLSISSDGAYAVVGFVDVVSYIDLNAGLVSANFPVAAGNASDVVLGNGFIYVLNATNNQAISVDIGSGSTTTFNDYNSPSAGVYNPVTNAIYASSYSNIERYSTSTGPLTTNGQKYFSSPSSCNRLLASPDNLRIYTGCGVVSTVPADASKELGYVSTIPGNLQIQYQAESLLSKRIAGILSPNFVGSPNPTASDTSVLYFDRDYLNPVGYFGLSAFQVGGNSYPSHGKGVFFSKDSSSLYVLVEADSSSGLTNDYAIQTIALTTPVACSVSLSTSTATTDAFGSLGSIGITAGTNCTFAATSNVPWIQTVSGFYGSGNTKLTFQVRPNPDLTTRTGTVSISNQTLTITQTGSGGAQMFRPLSFEVAAADYSKSLDRLILASSSSNELHVFDPVSGSDQVAALPSPAISLSVASDGHSAAVGHRGWVSIVDLQLLTVTKIIPVQADAQDISLAGNGYAYLFSSSLSPSSSSLSVKIDTGAITPSSLFGYNQTPRLSANGQSLYVGGFLARLDISTGLLQRGDASYSFDASTCGNLWLAEDGTRLLTSCGTAFRTTQASDDLTANGSLIGNAGITWAANSSIQHETAVITSRLPGYTSDDTKLQFYDDAALQFLNQTSLPSFPVGSTSYVGHGKYVFWDTAASKLYVVEQADAAAGMLSDFAVSTVSPLNIPQDCSYSLDHTSWYGGATATTNTYKVSVENGCPWTASTSSAFLSITAGASGSGAGMVAVAVAANPLTSYRTGTLTIANQLVSIQQGGIYSCISSFGPSSLNMPFGGGSASISILANSSCYWASSSNASWLSISTGSSGYGDGSIGISVAPNSGTTARTGTLIVSGSLVTVVQGGTALAETGGLRFVPLTPCRVADTRTYN